MRVLIYYYYYLFLLLIKITNYIYEFLYFFSKNLNTNTYNYFFIFLFYYFFRINLRKLYFIPLFFLGLQLQVYHGSKISVGLLIGFNSIHPYLFYLSFFISTIYFTHISYINIEKKVIYYMTLLALILGGWWGFGNNIWGYYWVNDVIEWVLLSIFLVIVVTFHSYSTKLNKILILSIFFILMYNLMLFRFGFFFTRHSFFDLKNIKNIYIIYTLLYFNNSIFLLYSFFYFLVYCYYYYLLAVIILSGWYVLSGGGWNNFLLHIVMFCLFSVWVKHKILNEIILVLNFFINTLLHYNLMNNGFLSNFFIVSVFKKFFLIIKCMYFYPFKIILKNIAIYSSYAFTVWILVFLSRSWT